MPKEPVSERMLAAVSEALDVDRRLSDPMRSASSAPDSARRAKLLRATRTTIEGWLEGDISEPEAVERIRAVARTAGES